MHVGVGGRGGHVERELAGELLGVALAQLGDDLLVVAEDRLERVGGDAGGDQLGGGAEEAVAEHDPVVEERERPAWLERLHPQRHLAELDGHRVHVDAVDAAADDVAQRRRGRSSGEGSGSLAADRGEPFGDSVGGGDQEVAGAAGGVDDGEGEDRLLGVLGCGGLVEDGLERGVEQR